MNLQHLVKFTNEKYIITKYGHMDHKGYWIFDFKNKKILYSFRSWPIPFETNTDFKTGRWPKEDWSKEECETFEKFHADWLTSKNE
jgi:hypothetical protein